MYGQAGWILAALLAVPLLLAWTLLYILCSLGGCQVFVVVAALVVTSGFADPNLARAPYAFDSSLLGERLPYTTGPTIGNLRWGSA